MAPFGKYTKAVRNGAPLAVVASCGVAAASDLNAPSDSNAGSAIARAESAQKVAAVESEAAFCGDGLIRVHGFVLTSARCVVGFTFSAASKARVFWNGADSMMPANNSDGRPFDFPNRSTIASTVATS